MKKHLQHRISRFGRGLSDLVWYDHSVRRAIWINLPGLSFLMLICAMAGLVMYARYYDCDPIMTKKVSSPDQVSAFNKNTTKMQAATYSYKHCHPSTIHKAKAILSSHSYVGLSYRHANGCSQNSSRWTHSFTNVIKFPRATISFCKHQYLFT